MEHDDFSSPVRTLSEDILLTVRDVIANGATVYDAYYTVCRQLPRGCTKHRFVTAAATPGSTLWRTVEEGRGLFSAEFVKKLLNQMDDGVAAAGKLLAEYRGQSEIDAAIAREFPGLFLALPENAAPADENI